MAEELKESLYEFLKENMKERFSIKQVYEKTKKGSYPTVLKWILILIAEGRVNVRDYGNVKIVWVE